MRFCAKLLLSTLSVKTRCPVLHFYSFNPFTVRRQLFLF